MWLNELDGIVPSFVGTFMARTIAVGVGYRRDTGAGEIVALIEDVLRANAIDAASVMGIGTASMKRGDAAVAAAAAHFGVAAHYFETGDAVAEAAALALAGPGGRLIAAKAKSARVTCALAALP